MKIASICGITCLLLVLLGESVPADSQATHGVSSTDLGRTALARLYNQIVVRIRRVKRPLKGAFGAIIDHSGVEVVLRDGKHWLIHKGKDYGGRGGNTIVTDITNMSRRWTPMTHWASSGLRVGNLVRIAGSDYNFLLDNCHRASMMLFTAGEMNKAGTGAWQRIRAAALRFW